MLPLLAVLLVAIGCGDAPEVDSDGRRTPPASTATTAPGSDLASYLRVFQDANGRLAEGAPTAQLRFNRAADGAQARADARAAGSVIRRFGDDLGRGRPPAKAVAEHRRVLASTRVLADTYDALATTLTDAAFAKRRSASGTAFDRVLSAGERWQADLNRLGDAVSRR